MKVYKVIWRYMEVYEGIWRYLKVYDVFLRIYEPTFSTLFFFNFLGVHFIDIVFSTFFEGLQALGGISFLFLMKLHIECRQKYVWGPPGGQGMTMCVKTYICGKVELGDTHG